MSLKKGVDFDANQIPQAIKKVGFTPGDIKATLTGTLTKVSQTDGQPERIALKMGESDQQNYILLENESLEARLKQHSTGESIPLTGMLSVYKNKHFVWLLPESKTQQKVTSLKGKFLNRGNGLVFKNGSDEYLVLENALREQVEKTKPSPDKKWSVKAFTTQYQGKKYIFLKKV